NSTGGALAMCDVDIDVDTTGRPIRRVKPFYTYSYGDALGDEDRPCRLVEFGIVYGRAELTYESLVTGQTFQRLIDLSRQRKDDSLAPLVGAHGGKFPPRPRRR